jgi:hypothetical protein
MTVWGSIESSLAAEQIEHSPINLFAETPKGPKKIIEI